MFKGNKRFLQKVLKGKYYKDTSLVYIQSKTKRFLICLVFEFERNKSVIYN